MLPAFATPATINPSRRRLLCAAATLLFAPLARALSPGLPADAPAPRRLDAKQSRAVRAWIVRIAETQVRRGPSPRWAQRACAGLVRFSVAEALAEHDARWRRVNGMNGRLPPDLVPEAARAALRHQWQRPDGTRGAYVNALGLVQENSVLVGRDVRLAQPADVLFFDQGEAQHLMLWTGRRIVYHNGSEPRDHDNGLRAVALSDLLRWNDTRWRPEAANPNFIGVFSLTFLI